MSTPQTPRATRSSVLGKRSQSDCSSSSSACEQVQTPETPTHKRIRISSTTVDGDANKENIAPFSISSSIIETSPASPRTTRSLRRNATETMVTPTRSRTQLMRTVSSPTTPATAISQISLATPPPTPSILLPIHARVRALLRPTCNDIHQLPGRESERVVITEFINSFLRVCDNTETETEADHANTSTLFVSGAPGTGKTALVTDVVQSLNQDDDSLRVLVLNCMALNGMDALWERLLEDLQGLHKSRSKKSKYKGREGIQEALKGIQKKCIVVLDELDHIASTSQALSQLFSLAASHDSILRIIGIANTHTLTSSPASIPEDVQTLHFAPYTSAQLEQILRSRLSSLQSEETSADDLESFKKFLPNPTITLLSKKVASLTGDVRALLEVLRGAIDLAVKPKTDADVLGASKYTVSPAHVLSALKAYRPSSSTTSQASSHPVAGSQPSSANSEIVTKTRALSFQSRLVLLSILLASKRAEAGLSLTSPSAVSGSPVKRSGSSPSLNHKGLSLDVSQLHSYHSLIMTRETNDSISSTVSRTEFGDLLVMLEGVGLVSMTSRPSSPTKSKARFSRSASFGGGKAVSSGEVKLSTGVWVDEVLRGLGVGASSADIREEEINALWVRESGRIAKDLKSVRAKARKEECGVGFADATED